MNDNQLWAYLFGGISVGVIWFFIEWLRSLQQSTQKKPLTIERPQLTVRIDVYKGDIVKIVATDAENRLMPDILQLEGQEKALKLVGYSKLPPLPVEAVREATTTLEPVSVEVEQGLDAVYPKTVEEAIEGLKPKGKKE